MEHVKAERNVLAEVHNPYVVKLYYSFQVGLPDRLSIQVLWRVRASWKSQDSPPAAAMTLCSPRRRAAHVGSMRGQPPGAAAAAVAWCVVCSRR